MTLVAVLFADEFPLVVTDSLLSRETAEDVGTLTPLLDDLDRRQGTNGHKPTGLTRKFWILPDRSLFLYAGTIGSAEEFFDRLSDRLMQGESLTRTLMKDVHARMSPNLKSFSCITLSPARKDAEGGELEGEAPHTFEAMGKVFQDDVPGYGYVLALGTGAEPFLQLLKKSPRPPEGDEYDTKVVATLNAAARATLSYRDVESGLAEASSGGYFEVLMPWMFEKSFQWLMRGTAHVFLEVSDGPTRLDRLVVAQQFGDRTLLLAGSDDEVDVLPNGFVCSLDAMYNVTIFGDRKRPPSVTRPASIPIPHIAAATLYGSRILPCGHEARSHAVLYAGDGPVATLLEEDGDLNPPPRSSPLLRFDDPSEAIQRLEIRLWAAQCPACVAAFR